MKVIKSALIALLLVAGLSAPLVISDVAGANAETQVRSGINATGTSGGVTLESAVANIVNMLLFIVGVVAVVVIIIGGIMYATSAGDPGRAKKAKDAIMYAVIGLAVAILAYAIVNFVVEAL